MYCVKCVYLFEGLFGVGKWLVVVGEFFLWYFGSVLYDVCGCGVVGGGLCMGCVWVGVEIYYGEEVVWKIYFFFLVDLELFGGNVF